MVIKFNDRKGQIFSTDIVVVILIVLFGAILIVVSQISHENEGLSLEEKYNIASSDANLIVNNLKSDSIISDDNQVNIDRLVLLKESEIKEELGIKNDFCIVFEKDGNLVKIDSERDIHGIGSEEIVVNGIPCK